MSPSTSQSQGRRIYCASSSRWTAGPRPSRARWRGPKSTDTAYLQYTSGSTRQPAGVMVSHRNILANFEQINAGFSGTTEATPHRTPHGVLAAVLSRHGIISESFAPVLTGMRTVSPVRVVPEAAGPVDAIAGNQQPTHFRQDRTSLSNWRRERHRRRHGWSGSGRGDSASSAVPSGCSLRHCNRFTERFARFNLQDKALRPSYGMAEATVYVATRAAGQPPRVVHFESDEADRRPREAAARAEAVRRWSVMACRGHRWCASSIPRPALSAGGNDRRDLGARRQRRCRLLAETRRDGADIRRGRWSRRRRARLKGRG